MIMDSVWHESYLLNDIPRMPQRPDWLRTVHFT